MGVFMRFPEAVRMADDGDPGPVWARSKRRSGGGLPIVGLLVTLLALFGALTAVLGIKEQSVGKGGALIDGWISLGWDTVRGKAPEMADEAVAGAGEAAGKAGDALQAGAATTAAELKKE